MENIRLSRLFRLITLLRGGTAYDVRRLADALEMSVRNIYRDLEALRRAGVPCGFDREFGGYRIRGNFFLPPVQLTLEEALSLSVLASQLAGQKQIPFMDRAAEAMAKIQSQLPASIQDELANLDGRIDVQTARHAPQSKCDGYYHIIRRAIASRRKLRCVYDGGSDSKPFLFRPYSLFFCQRAWYAIGLSEKRAGERSLKLDRLSSVEQTPFPYMIPDDWNTAKMLGNAWRMIRGKKRYKIVVRFDAEYGRTMAETLWHPTQMLQIQSDGSYLFQCEVDGLDEIVWWILAYGPHAQVLQPQELSGAVKAIALQTLELYKHTAVALRSKKLSIVS